MTREPTVDVEVRTYFVRGRNALLARADFGELYAAWFLHRMDTGIQLSPVCEEPAREALAAITLHAAGRPWNELCAWTVHFAAPLLNIFASADNTTGNVVVNAYTEHVKALSQGRFYADVVEGTKPARRSVVDFEGGNFLRAVEAFYAQSEQRLARFFWHGDEDLVMVSAQPDCDLEWLQALDVTKIRTIDQTAELSLLECRKFRFECGCSQERMCEVLLPIYQRQGDDLFEKETDLRIKCPRCGASYKISRDELHAMG